MQVPTKAPEPSQNQVRERERGGALNTEPTEQRRPNKFMKAKEIARKIRSFDHFIYLWGEKAKYYLPPKRFITWHYISQVLSCEKRLLKLDQVGHVAEIPKLKGNLLKDMWDRCKDTNELNTFFPDIHDSQQVPRDYFFNVASAGSQGGSA